MVRVRPCRRIDLRGQVRIYNEDLAFIHKILINTNNSFFKNQQIKYYVLLPTLDLQGNVLQNRKSLLIVTNEYLLYIRVYNFLDLQSEKYLQKCLMMSEKLSNIFNYAIKAKPSRFIQAKSASGKKKDSKSVYIGQEYFLTMTFESPVHESKTIQLKKQLVGKMNLSENE